MEILPYSSRLPENKSFKEVTRSSRRPLVGSLLRVRNLLMAGIIIGTVTITACNPEPKPITSQQIETACQITTPKSSSFDNYDIFAPHGIRAVTYPTTEIEIYNPGHYLVNWNIYVHNRNGAVLFDTNNPNFDESDPTLSPDGKKVVFVRKGPLKWVDKEKFQVTNERTGLEGLYVVNLKDNSVRRLTAPSKKAIDEQPSWSPDSQKIVFTKRYPDKDGRYYEDVYTIIADGLSRRLTNYQGTNNSIFRPTFSPNGRSIAYQDRTSTYVLDADGSNHRKVSEGGHLESPQGRDVGLVWLPDSSGLVIQRSKRLSNTEFGHRKFVFKKDGSYPTNITAICPPQNPILD